MLSQPRPISALSVKASFLQKCWLKAGTLVLPKPVLTHSFLDLQKPRPSTPTAHYQVPPRVARNVPKAAKSSLELSLPEKPPLVLENKQMYAITVRKSEEAILSIGAAQDPNSYSGQMLALHKQQKRLVISRKKPLVSEITGKHTVLLSKTPRASANSSFGETSKRTLAGVLRGAPSQRTATPPAHGFLSATTLRRPATSQPMRCSVKIEPRQRICSRLLKAQQKATQMQDGCTNCNLQDS